MSPPRRFVADSLEFPHIGYPIGNRPIHAYENGKRNTRGDDIIDRITLQFSNFTTELVESAPGPIFHDGNARAYLADATSHHRVAKYHMHNRRRLSQNPYDTRMFRPLPYLLCYSAVDSRQHKFTLRRLKRALSYGRIASNRSRLCAIPSM